jgi:hypothetical protein
MPWHMGVLVLQEPVPVILPLATVALPVNSTKLPFASPKTKSSLIVELSVTGLADTPIKTPSPVSFAKESVGAMAFWEDMQRYVYLPRLKDRNTLEQAIVKGAATKDFFGTDPQLSRFGRKPGTASPSRREHMRHNRQAVCAADRKRHCEDCRR